MCSSVIPFSWQVDWPGGTATGVWADSDGKGRGGSTGKERRGYKRDRWDCVHSGIALRGENAVERNVVKPRRKEEWPRENSERR